MLPPAEENVEELQDEKLDLKLDTNVSDDRTEVVQQVLQNVVAATDTPSVAMDVDAAPIQVDLSDFGERTAPKSDLMATIGGGCRLRPVGRGARRARCHGRAGRRHQRKRGGGRRGAQVVRRAPEPRRKLELRPSHRTVPGTLLRCGHDGRLPNRRNGHGPLAVSRRGTNASARPVQAKRRARPVFPHEPDEGPQRRRHAGGRSGARPAAACIRTGWPPSRCAKPTP